MKRSLLAAIFTFATTSAAAAHPLGNFTVNHLTRVVASPTAVTMHYSLDLAELPSAPILRGSLPEWRDATARDVTAQLALRYDGRTQPLRLVDARTSTRPGAGGLRTIQLAMTFVAPPLEQGARLEFADDTYSGRIGWKDVVLDREFDPTNGLRTYPADLLGSPRANTTASALATRRGLRRIAAPAQIERPALPPAPSLVRSNVLAEMLARARITPAFVILTLLAALALGALHGLEPGHGKTLMAVSLVGARATARQALILGGAITFTHTIGVIALGIVLLFATRYVVPEAIYPWITLASGIVVVVIGARALTRALGAHHAHSHDAAAPVSFGAIVIAAGTGGIAPCPAALVVLMTALTVHRVGYGLALIVAFSLGLAAILVALGLAVVRGAAWIGSRRGFERFAKAGPFVSAGVIALLGAVMLGEGFTQVGVTVPALAVSALALAAIGGYAASSLGHHHGVEAT
ncbi:MAG: hypothetical protein JO293_07780 [Candidatus Eremiobacteraeota bacterium]|nr:hypothetical protein [Candidatus Eremiobacteraeota bacterium]